MIKQLCAVLCFSIAVSSSLEAKTAVDENRDIASDGVLQVENLAGTVEITAWDQPGVHIGGELGKDVEKLEIQETSSGLKVRVRNRKNQRNVDETHLLLSVPATVSLVFESVSSDLRVNGLESESVDFQSVSGDLTAQVRMQRIEVETVSGDLVLSGLTQRASISSVSGDVELAGVTDELDISTVSGDVVVTDSQIIRGGIQTVSGDLTISLEVADRGRLNIESMSGDVRLQLPKAQQAEITAQTYSGNISSDFGDISEQSRGSGKSLHVTVGDNGSLIEVESFSGNIQLRSN